MSNDKEEVKCKRCKKRKVYVYGLCRKCHDEDDKRRKKLYRDNMDNVARRRLSNYEDTRGMSGYGIQKRLRNYE